MKTPWMFLLAIGCGAPAPVHQPTHQAEPTVMLMGSVETQLASWKPSPDVGFAAASFDGPALAVAAARPERCSLRVTSAGVTVDGEKHAIDDAIAICALRAAVLVEVAEDADQALWSKLDTAFAKAKVPVLHRGVRGDTDNRCLTSPFSKACLER